VETIELEIAMENDLITKTRDLAVRYFDDDSDECLAQVVEMAFRMRALWSHSIKQGQQETGEAVSTWEFPESTPRQEDSDSVQGWLFRR
jgi:hypothetical protein